MAWLFRRSFPFLPEFLLVLCPRPGSAFLPSHENLQNVTTDKSPRSETTFILSHHPSLRRRAPARPRRSVCLPRRVVVSLHTRVTGKVTPYVGPGSSYFWRWELEEKRSSRGYGHAGAQEQGCRCARKLVYLHFWISWRQTLGGDYWSISVTQGRWKESRGEWKAKERIGCANVVFGFLACEGMYSMRYCTLSPIFNDLRSR